MNNFSQLITVALMSSLISISLMKIFEGNPAKAESKQTESVLAQNFVVVDEKGNKRASFGVDFNGMTGIKIFDANGDIRGAFLIQDKGPANISLTDYKSKKPTVSLTSTIEGEHGLTLSGNQGVRQMSVVTNDSGSSVVSMFDKNQQPRAFMIVTEENTSGLGLFNYRGETTWSQSAN